MSSDGRAAAGDQGEPGSSVMSSRVWLFHTPPTYSQGTTKATPATARAIQAMRRPRGDGRHDVALLAAQ